MSPATPPTAGFIRLDDAVAKTGCAFVVTHRAGTAQVVVLHRSDMPVRLPDLEVLPSNAAALHVVRYKLRRSIGGTPREITLACLSPYSRSFERELARSIRSAESSGDWRAVESALASAPIIRVTTPPEALAGDALRAKLFPNARRLSAGRLGSAFTALDEPYPWYSDTGKANLMGAAVVYAAPTYFVVDLYWLYASAQRFASFSDFVNWDYLYGDEEYCADASSYWIATEEEVRSMEELTPYIEQASIPLESYGCDRIPSKPICIDFFIMNRRSTVFAGDDRDFDPYAGINSSRVHVYLNPSTLEQQLKINSTRLRFGETEIWPVYDSVGTFRQEEHVRVSRATDGHIEVVVKFYNNYCTSRVECPSIDATIHLIPDSAAPGGYRVAWNRDGFPSMGIYKLAGDGATYISLAEDPERIRDPWLNWLGLIDGVRRSNRLPPGCTLQ